MIYSNIDDAILAIEKCSKDKGMPVYYRGQHHNWPVTSSLFRLDASATKKAAEEAVDFVNWLKSRTDIFNLSNAEKSLGDLSYWAIAQHYGYKTDFIDFTTDINIAKGFALIGKQVGEVGCIICLWQDDVDFICDLVRAYSEEALPKVLDLLESINYNPFLQFNWENISRIKNQRGIFLWDIHSQITQFFGGLLDQFDPGFSESHIFNFYQDERDIPIDILRLIYPEPNKAEVEIDSFQQDKNRQFYYQHRIIPEFPPNSCDLSEHFTKNIWDDRIMNMFELNPTAVYPAVDQQIVKKKLTLAEITDLLNSLEKCQEFAQEWILALEKKEYIVYTNDDNQSTLIIFTELLNEIVSTIALWNLREAKILGIIIYQAFRLMIELLSHAHNVNPDAYFSYLSAFNDYNFDLSNHGINSFENILDNIRSLVSLDTVVKEAWEQDFIFVRLLTKYNHSIITVISEYVSNECLSTGKIEHIRILKELNRQNLLPPTKMDINKDGSICRKKVDENSIKWDLMLDVVPDVRVCFEQSEFIRNFIYHMLPWQFVMNPKRSRLYNPLEITQIRRIDADNWGCGHIYYWGGMYCHV